MSSASPNASGELFGTSADDELQRWQRVEAEAWGMSLPTEAAAAVEVAEDRQPSRPIAFFALVALVAIAALWLFTRLGGPQDDLAAKAVVAPVGREVATPCAVLGELRDARSKAYVRLLGEDDPVRRVKVVGQQVRAEVRLLDQLIELESSLTMSVAPVRFRSKFIADGIPAVDSGGQTLEGLIAAADEAMGPQAVAGEQAVAEYEAQACPAPDA